MLGDFCGENTIHQGNVLHTARLTEPGFKARSCAEGQQSTVRSDSLSAIKMAGMLLAELSLDAKGCSAIFLGSVCLPYQPLFPESNDCKRFQQKHAENVKKSKSPCDVGYLSREAVFTQ